MSGELEARLNAVERLTVLFRVERFVYLGVTGVALLMLLGTAGSLIYREQAGAAEQATVSRRIPIQLRTSLLHQGVLPMTFPSRLWLESSRPAWSSS